MESISISLEKKELDYLDALVEKGVFANRSDAVRNFIKDARRRKEIRVPLEDMK